MSGAHSYLEATARQRLDLLFGNGGLDEWLPPAARLISPHLAQLDTPTSFDDGVVIGCGKLGRYTVFAAAQEGGFMGGAVGEVHGAKLVGLLRRAVRDRPDAVLLLLDSGGVRLHEANAGLIAVSEVMRALLAVRAALVPVVVLIGGANGCFGGMGIVARCANAIIMSEQGRLAMSGPEVIETASGVEEFDSRDRALVWRTTGGKHRYLMGDCDRLVSDRIDAFRTAAIEMIGAVQGSVALTLAALEAEQLQLHQRIQLYGAVVEPMDLWAQLGIGDPAGIAMLEPQAFSTLAATSPLRSVR